MQRVTDAWQRVTEQAQAADETSAAMRDAEPRGAPGPVFPANVVFIGGAGDALTRLVANEAEEFGRRNPAMAAQYFSHDQMEEIRNYLDALPRGTCVSMVGHSWGGDTAAEIASALGREGRQVDNLILVDPVRREPDAPDTNLYAGIRVGQATG